MANAKTGEATVVTVGRDPVAVGLDRDRGEVSVGDQVAACADLGAEFGEDLPVSLTW